jgi:hypothetical protein
VILLLSNGGKCTMMTAQSCVRGTRWNRATPTTQENKFKEIYLDSSTESAFLQVRSKGEVQHARMHEPGEKKGTAGPTNPAKEGK